MSTLVTIAVYVILVVFIYYAVLAARVMYRRYFISKAIQNAMTACTRAEELEASTHQVFRNTFRRLSKAREVENAARRKCGNGAIFVTL